MKFEDKDMQEEDVHVLVMRALNKLRDGESKDYVYSQFGEIIGEWSLTK